MKQKKNDLDIKIWVIACGVVIIAILPFLVSKIYSIDDYHLLNVYDLNWDTLGYNYYSTGRFVEGIISELLYHLNLQPVNKPTGAICFAVVASLAGVYIMRHLNISSTQIKLLLTLVIVLNPFFIELYYYGTVTIYCGFALFFLLAGFYCSDEYNKGKKRKHLILSVIFYVCSLGTYQIFYPIIGFVIVIEGIMGLKDSRKEKWQNWARETGIYFFSFLFFYVILRIMFWVRPPELVYDGIDMIQFLKDFFSSEYWDIMSEKIRVFLMEDNIFISSLAIKMVYIVLFAVCMIKLLKREKSFGAIIISFLYAFMGLYFVFGFGVTRPGAISGRTLTAYGVYEVGLFLFMLEFCEGHRKWQSVVIALLAAVIFMNISMIGKNALNTMRLNEIELNMANRIVARMETFQEFSTDAVVVIMGTPAIGQIGQIGMGDYNVPASASFSQVFLLNEATGYTFAMPTKEQTEAALEYIEQMDTWPGDGSVVYQDGMFIVRLYY